MMNEPEVSQHIKCGGTLVYDITGEEPAADVFRKLWELATDFAVVNSYIPVISDSTGKKKKQEFERQFGLFPALRQAVTKAWWASEWPGTVSSKPDRFLAYGNTKQIGFDQLLANQTTLFWQGPGCWDDLMLFSKGTLIFYVCTHEKFGQIFGDKVLYNRMKLNGVISNKLPNFAIKGVEIEEGFLAGLLHSTQ